MARGLIKQSKWTSNCGARRQEGRRRGGRADVWSWVSELTGAGQGEGEKTCPPGNPQDPLSFSPPTITSTTTPNSTGSFSLLAGVPFGFYVAPCSPQSNPQTLPVRAFMTVWTVHQANLLSFAAPLLLVCVLLFCQTFTRCWTFCREH